MGNQRRLTGGQGGSRGFVRDMPRRRGSNRHARIGSDQRLTRSIAARTSSTVSGFIGPSVTITG
jgi:hypothetical protein